MDCKHGSIDIALGRNQINCRRCGESLDKDGVIAITKAQHQLMQNVIKAGRKLKRAQEMFEDGWRAQILSHDGDIIVYESYRQKQLFEALTAYDERKE